MDLATECANSSHSLQSNGTMTAHGLMEGDIVQTRRDQSGQSAVHRCVGTSNLALRSCMRIVRICSANLEAEDTLGGAHMFLN